MAKPLIIAKHLSLHVPVFKAPEQKISKNVTQLMRGLYANQTRRESRQLLRGINFELHPGERIGVIGRNGAGKTTLLRVLCGIYQHTGGALRVRGKIHGLFTVSLGINPRATGVENIYLRGLQMGLSIDQIKSMLPEVIEFADIGASINDTFDTYSTGMRLRLAVAISTMITPELLVLDEWIGAGDQEFRKKIKMRMHQIVDKSKGMVIATHTRGLMKNLCTHGLVMDKGKMVYYGPIDDALHFYDEIKDST